MAKIDFTKKQIDGDSLNTDTNNNLTWPDKIKIEVINVLFTTDASRQFKTQ